MTRRLATLLLPLLLLAACDPKVDPVEPETPTSLAVPQNVRLHEATESMLTFQWSPVEKATGYSWRLTSASEADRSGSVATRNATIGGLSAGTQYSFSVCAIAGSVSSDYSATVSASTAGEEPGPIDPPGPIAEAVCVDAPIVIEYPAAVTLGSSGYIRVFKGSTEVDSINLADIATVDILEDGTMIPKVADADAGKIAIGNDYVFNTFMDALHSNQYRAVHYTPLRVDGNKLIVKLHNEALDFGATYTVKVDASVAGMTAEDVSITTKARPAGTSFTVAADGSGDFCTVQGALSFVSSGVKKDDAASITVQPGTYRELLFLRGKNNLTIKGASREGCVIAYPNNDSYETGSGGSLSSKPKVGAQIGKSGGRSLFLVESCDNLTLQDLTIENTYSIPSHKGQAETIYFNSQYKMTIENCSLISWQDTFLTKGKVWVHNSLIAGHVDFIWGYPEACLFEDCEIRARAGGYIVQARIEGASRPGFVFLNCKLTAEDGVKDGVMYLARSGGDASVYDNVVFVNCTMAPVIAPTGWHTGKTPNPAVPTATSGWREYGSLTPSGASASGARNNYGLVLTAAQAEPYSSRAAVLGY